MEHCRGIWIGYMHYEYLKISFTRKLVMSLYVFNQYYLDLLKKLKHAAKAHKMSGSSRVSRATLIHSGVVRAAIKKHYLSFDKISGEYMSFFRKSTIDCAAPWTADESDCDYDARVKSVEDALEWMQSDDIRRVELYKGITFGAAEAVLRSSKSLLHYYVLLCIFSKQPLLPEEEASALLEQIKSIKKLTTTPTQEFDEGIRNIECDVTRAHINFLLSLHVARSGSVSGSRSGGSGSVPQSKSSPGDADGILDDDNPMKDMESTTLGKLAKEIMEDINVEDLQKSMSGGDGDILKALSDPEGGMSKLLGTVSQKMLSKLASGEIKQDTLLQDALQFSSKIKHMLPKEAQGLGDIGNMMSQMGDLSKMLGGGGGGFDMSTLSEMMGMFNGGSGSGSGSGSRERAQSRAKEDISRSARAKQMRRNLEKRRNANANANAASDDR